MAVLPLIERGHITKHMYITVWKQTRYDVAPVCDRTAKQPFCRSLSKCQVEEEKCGKMYNEEAQSALPLEEPARLWRANLW